MESKSRVLLSCAQPTGVLTIGNYLGAVKSWSGMMDEFICFFGIVDLHAITSKHNPSEIRKNTISSVAQYLACGLDPLKSKIFVQSHILGHTELCWILSSITSLGELKRMTQFKSKAALLSENNGNNFLDEVDTGLLMYPVLMAADILLYNADLVPVGDDQKQHLELCRNLAQKFNNKYSDTFKIPEAYIHSNAQRVMSLQNPEIKMSKSDISKNGTLYILDGNDTIRKKILSAVTDSNREIVYLKERKGLFNLLNIYSSFSDEKPELIVENYSSKTYNVFKNDLSDLLISKLEPIKLKYNELMDDRVYLEGVLKEGAESAQKLAFKTLRKVYKKCGFLNRLI